MRISDWSSDVCSSDLQKALLLGLVLAHAALVAARTQHAPILLLDEVAAHLDPVRRAALFDRLAGMAGQVWMTGTEPALFDAIAGGATRYTVTDRSEEHTSELQSLMRISYAVFCLKKKK